MKKIAVIIVLCFVAFFVNNSVILPDIMESRNIITAREMVYEGHWMVPTMNGELRLEKPPLPTWIAGAVERFYPDNISAQRAMAALAATMLVLFFYLLGKRLFGKESYAFIASLLLITCYNIILMGRTASWDIYCHAFMMGAIYFMCLGFYEKRSSYAHFALMGLFLGLSFLSKGPVSFYALLLPFLIAMILYDRPSMQGKGKPLLLGVILCILIGSWWYIYLLAFHPDAIQYVLHKESSAWVEHNVRPWWYYWKFFLETGVWSLLMLTSLLVWFWKDRVRDKKKYLMAVVWTLAALVLLSCLPEKKSRYLLPMLIPCCYSMAFVMHHWISDRRCGTADRALFRLNAGLVAVVTLALPVLLYLLFYSKDLLSGGRFVLCGAMLIALAAVLIYSAVRWEPQLFLTGVVFLFAVAEIFLMDLVGKTVNNPEFHSVVLTRDMPQLKDIPFYYNEKKELRIEMVYEAHRKIRPVDVSNADSIRHHLPMAILTHQRVGEELPASLWRDVDSVYVGRFDDNRRPKDSKRYSELFLYHITLLKQKHANK